MVGGTKVGGLEEILNLRHTYLPLKPKLQKMFFESEFSEKMKKPEKFNLWLRIFTTEKNYF